MKITIESTTRIVNVNGMDCRVWEGVTEPGDAAPIGRGRSVPQSDDSMKAPWVVAAGAPRETAHCTRCGEGLDLGSKPQLVEVALAAMRAFIKCHANCKPGQHTEPAITRQNWPASRDTGISSATIWYAFTGNRIYGNDFGVPHDPDDFGRCYRLLKLCPEWESQLEDMLDMFPQWKRFVLKWPKLKELYEEALRTGDGKPMYEFMEKLEETPHV